MNNNPKQSNMNSEIKTEMAEHNETKVDWSSLVEKIIIYSISQTSIDYRYRMTNVSQKEFKTLNEMTTYFSKQFEKVWQDQDTQELWEIIKDLYSSNMNNDDVMNDVVMNDFQYRFIGIVPITQAMHFDNQSEISDMIQDFIKDKFHMNKLHQRN